MWNTGRISRTPSMQSLARSGTSSPGSSYGGSTGQEEEFLPPQTGVWQAQRKAEPSVQVVELHQRRPSISTDDSQNSTLALDVAEEDDDDDENETDAKTPTINDKAAVDPRLTSTVCDDPPEPASGPLSQILSSLLSHVSRIEKDRPTIMAEDYRRLEDRVAALEAERETWQQRHEALFALRDEDVANLVKVRGLLADERRAHAAMRKLRDDDLRNVIALRDKLAQAIWAKPERGQGAKVAARESRPEGNDLWQAAKTAAMEQRVLELEKANKELRAQTAVRGDMGWIEAMFEDGLRYREKMAAKVQQLRSEKEALQKESERMEDRIEELEVVNERLQRRGGLEKC